MKQIGILTGVLLLCSLYAESPFRIENTNFTISQASFDPLLKERYLYNYDRLRGYADWKEDGYFFKAIGDIVNYLGQSYTDSPSFGYIKMLKSDTYWRTRTPFHDYSGGAAGAKIYRLYGGYEDDDKRMVLGLQNITMGVGHIWTPSNLFNPRNTYSLEPDETFGVTALSYTRYLSDQSQLYGVISRRRDKSWKYAAGFKTTVGRVDFALNSIKSDDTEMIAYAIEGDLGDTGIEIRSEGAYIESTLSSLDGREEERDFFQGIIGADYAFRQGLELTVEALYSSETFTFDESIANINSELSNDMVMSHLYLGVMMGYNFTIYLSASLLYIESFSDENSRFAAPSLTYTPNDNNSLTLGAMLYGGPSESEFGMWGNTYYLKYTLNY